MSKVILISGKAVNGLAGMEWNIQKHLMDMRKIVFKQLDLDS